MNTEFRVLALESLRAHPRNSNVMPAGLFAKLKERLRATDRCPPIIVRVSPDGDGYQILDGHHRVLALRELGRAQARCDVWDVDEAEALTLLATLNRLQGRDDPHKRAELIEELRARLDVDVAELVQRLPEDRAAAYALLALRRPGPQPRPPVGIADVPMAVHFFLPPGDREALERRLKELGGTREQALMWLVRT